MFYDFYDFLCFISCFRTMNSSIIFSKVSLSSAVMLALEDLFCSLKSISSLKESGPQMQ